MAVYFHAQSRIQILMEPDIYGSVFGIHFEIEVKKTYMYKCHI
jgi:hypothetical protein